MPPFTLITCPVSRSAHPGRPGTRSRPPRRPRSATPSRASTRRLRSNSLRAEPARGDPRRRQRAPAPATALTTLTRIRRRFGLHRQGAREHRDPGHRGPDQRLTRRRHLRRVRGHGDDDAALRQVRQRVRGSNTDACPAASRAPSRSRHPPSVRVVQQRRHAGAPGGGHQHVEPSRSSAVEQPAAPVARRTSAATKPISTPGQRGRTAAQAAAPRAGSRPLSTMRGRARPAASRSAAASPIPEVPPVTSGRASAYPASWAPRISSRLPAGHGLPGARSRPPSPCPRLPRPAT